MGYRMRIFFTDMQTSEIWDRWQRAAAMSSIGRRFDRVSSSIYPLLERSGLGKFNDAVSIRERPAEAEDRAVPGHHCRQGRQGEGGRSDCRFRQQRHSGAHQAARKLPKELYRSLILDRGTEMAGHRKFTLATDIDVFLCEPHSPWQRGSNENTNRLLRQYFPKRNRFVDTSSGKVERRCKTAQRATSKDAGIRNTSGTF